MVFFADRDLGAHLFPQIVRQAGISLEIHADHFAADARDEDWIPVVATRGWFILTHNERIRYVAVEREAVIRSKAGMFVLVGQTTTVELGHNFVNTHRKISAFLARHHPPFIAKVFRPSPPSEVALGKPGRVELWLP